MTGISQMGQPLGLPGDRVADADVDPREAILEVKGLRTSFPTGSGFVHAVDNVSFNVRKGEALALVGESGCGKSVTAMSIMRLVATPGRITAGEVRFKGRNLAELSEREMRTVRGNDIAMVFQEPMTSLNPVFKIGTQVAEAVRIHNKVSRKEAWKRAGEMLELVSIPDPIKRLDDYPHQLSGGMRQRVMIAMALSCDPELLIADEPTTALDVTIQAQIMELLASLQQRLGLAILLITHDLGVVAEFCERVLVMYTGRVVEEAPVRELFANPAHPYTRGLLKSLPSVSAGDPTAPHRLPTIKGMVPPITSLPPGCKFNPRCPDVMDICLGNEPARMIVTPGHDARCYLHGDEADPDRLERI
ncbi:MAG: peptide/nickel transport system ATP-binding protein [Thermoanaerobaculia bacterium]|jgi:oligopeptide/dipeptide ABC transporter ATP-binding protein|nr:peptide/nickel transport system ATP-binding protein [Thermoanaerobaculia bacterium]